MAEVARSPRPGTHAGMSSDRRDLEDLVSSMKRAAAALRDADIPFMLGGGLAAWARGGPRSDNDVDFFVREDEAERALEALVESGMRAERPPEEWLLKAHDGDVLVDLIYRHREGRSTASSSRAQRNSRCSATRSSSPRSTTSSSPSCLL